MANIQFFGIRIIWFGVFMISSVSFGQVEAVVVDSLSKQVVPYVNIWVENEDKSTMSNNEGFFVLREIRGSKILVLSASGYKSKKINSDLVSDTLKIQRQIIGLDEVIVKAPIRKRRKRINKIKKSKIGHYLPGFKKAWMFAKFFEYDSTYARTPYLEKVKIATLNYGGNGKFNIRFFTANDKGEPEGYVYGDNIIVTAEEGKRITIVDINQLNIKFPETGFFVAVEWIQTTENFGIWNSINPEIGFLQLESDINSWYYKFGKWQKIWKNGGDYKHYKDKYNHLALELVLTN